MAKSIESAKTQKLVENPEEDNLLRSLRQHGQVKETTDPNAELDPGQTHLLIKKPGDKAAVLVEKRKSFF